MIWVWGFFFGKRRYKIDFAGQHINKHFLSCCCFLYSKLDCTPIADKAMVYMLSVPWPCCKSCFYHHPASLYLAAPSHVCRTFFPARLYSHDGSCPYLLQKNWTRSLYCSSDYHLCIDRGLFPQRFLSSYSTIKNHIFPYFLLVHNYRPCMFRGRGCSGAFVYFSKRRRRTSCFFQVYHLGLFLLFTGPFFRSGLVISGLVEPCGVDQLYPYLIGRHMVLLRMFFPSSPSKKMEDRT